jgi:hypothetical protein
MAMVVHLSPDTMRREGLSEAEIAEQIALGQNDLYIGFEGGAESYPDALEEWRWMVVENRRRAS